MSSEQDQVRQLAERIARRMSAKPNANDGQTRGARDGNVGGELQSLRETIGELQQRLSQIESHMTGDVDERQSQGASSVHRQESGRQEAIGAQVRNDSSRSDAPATRSPWLSGVYFPVQHPSMEKFGVDEAAVSELVDFFEKEKTCSLEPGEKPCDHCAMCNSRGF